MLDEGEGAIVHDLAAGNPIAAYETTGELYCTLCDADFINVAERTDDPSTHAEDCPWRRAREHVALERVG